jgi:oligopeptide transport system substrate-binding protein
MTMHVSRRRVLAFILMALPAITTTGCRVRLPELDRLVRRAGGEQILVLTGSRPTTLDPALAQDVVSANYIVEIFSGLVSLDAKLQVVPDLAARWAVSPDGRTYTFELRRGVRFQSGREVTAQDIKYSLERATDPALQSRVAETYLGDIEGVRERLQGRAREIAGVRVKDDLTIEITIDAPKPYFLAKLTYPTAFVVDRANVERGRDWYREPNGTGPFRLARWDEDERIVLVRNDAYYGRKPALARVEFLLDLGPQATMALYERGELDITQVSVTDIDRATDKKNPLNKELRTVDALDVYYVGFNVRARPFDDVRVRQAFALAIDKEKLTRVVLRGMATPARGILPPGLPGYNEKLVGLSFDPVRARRLLAETPYQDGAGLPPITLVTSGETGGLGRVPRALLDMWKQHLGVEVTVRQVDFPTFLQELDRPRNRPQMFELGWVADYPDPQNFLDLLFHSQSGENHTFYANAEVDRLLEQARTERDQGRRYRLYHEAEQIIVNEAPIVPLYHSRNYVLIKPRVQNAIVAPVVLPWLKDVSVKGR